MNDEIEARNAEPNPEPRPTATSKTASKGGRGKKIAHSLVVASATAVLAVFGAGYAATQSAAAQVAAQTAIPTATQTTTASGSPTATTGSGTAVAPTATATPSATATPTAAEASTPAATTTNTPAATSTPAGTSTPTATATTTAATSTYKDGTYTGTGVSRHGSITAQVVIQNGKIVSVQITGSTTRYSTSRIASLPGEVVAQQSPNVDYVSGATDSSMAFMQAVADALAQASGGGS
jgi:uncharacterized protein with FMN-binding domain